MEKINTPPPECLLMPSPAQHTTYLVQQVISAILYKFDPSNINFDGENFGEYNHEAKSIWARMNDCKDANALKIIIDNVFTQSFGNNWGSFVSLNHKSLHLGFMARQIWTMKQILIN